MFSPSPGLWPGLIEERQHRFLRSARPRRAERPGMRVVLGHLLIAAGSSLSGERVELPPRRPALPRSA